MKTVDQAGLPEDVPMMGMPAESSWVLNGSYIDYSMIRNYMGYTLSGQLLHFTPRCRLCEVFTSDANGALQYQGVYTVIEKIKVSEHRVALEKADASHAETSFLVQINSHLGSTAIPHLKPDGHAAFPFSLEYPSPELLSQNSLHYIRQQLLLFEKALYDAPFSGDWSGVNDYIDMDSFVDYYLINEFFQNLDAGSRSTFLYQNMGGKISIGPVWDFDGSLSNQNFTDADVTVDYHRMDSTFFYHFLFQNPEFTTRCYARYLELRRGVLSEKILLAFIDSCQTYLEGPAQRNCQRWYNGDASLWQQDLNSIRTFIHERGKWMDENFHLLCNITK